MWKALLNLPGEMCLCEKQHCEEGNYYFYVSIDIAQFSFS